MGRASLGRSECVPFFSVLFCVGSVWISACGFFVWKGEECVEWPVCEVMRERLWREREGKFLLPADKQGLPMRSYGQDLICLDLPYDNFDLLMYILATLAALYFPDLNLDYIAAVHLLALGCPCFIMPC
ncbi:hypothetical protein COLO4_06532 [Corchorus olitorius]|uniref:Uncharacterized protein n=1 Tax=Corchorus olitorius TaxID=93759 RepID=A0A1R3KMU4_9ROSI|nr:hypothetical protein COLO4_06532 [Corchorus olitorius]